MGASAPSCGDAAPAICEIVRRYDAVTSRLFSRNVLHGNHAGAAGLGRIRHLLQRSIAAVPDDVVGQDHRERLVADYRFGAQHCVPQTQGFGLCDEDRAHAFGQHVADEFELLGLAGPLELLFKLVGLVEIVRHSVLVAVGDEDQRVATRLDGFVDRVLDQWPIDDRQHFLGNGLGGGEESCTQSSNRKDGLADTGMSVRLR